MGIIKIGNRTYNDKFLDQDKLKEYKSKQESAKVEKAALQKYSEEDGFINKVKTFFGDGNVLPQLAHESERYAEIRKQQEEARKKTASQAFQQIGKSAREMVNPTYGYSREQLAEAAPSVWEKTKGIAKGVGRFATDIASLAPLAIEGIGYATGSEGLKKVGKKLAEVPEFIKGGLQPKSAGEAKAASFTELGLNVIPMGQISKGKFLSKIAKLTDASEIEKLLIAGKLVPKTLPAEDIARVAESLTKIKDEKSIINTIYAESIFKKAELAIGQPLSDKAKMMVEASIKMAPIENPEQAKSFTEAIIGKIQETLPPAKQITAKTDSRGAKIETNALGDVVRITEKDGKITYEDPAFKKPTPKEVKAIETDPQTDAVTIVLNDKWDTIHQATTEGKISMDERAVLEDLKIKSEKQALTPKEAQSAVEPLIKSGINLPDEMKLTKLEGVKPMEVATKSVSVEASEKTVAKLAKKEASAAELEAKQLAKNAREKVKLVNDLEKRITKAAREENAELVATLKAQKKVAIESANKAIKTAKQAEAKMGVSVKKTDKFLSDGTYGQAYKSPKVITTQRKLLKEKFKNLTKGAKEGKKFGFKIVKDIKKKIHEYASDLPLPVRKALLSKKYMQGITSESKLEKALARIDDARNKFYNETGRLEVLREVMPLKKLAREKGLLPNVNMRVRGAFPRFKTIDGQKVRAPFTDSMIKGMSKDELIEYKKFLTEAMDTTAPKLDRSTTDFSKIGKVGSSLTKTGTFLDDVKKGIRSVVGVASTNVRRLGGEKLFYQLRERTLELNRLSHAYSKKMEEFQEGMRKLGKAKEGFDHTEISDALFNQDFARARAIASKHGFEKSLDNVISILEDIHARANAVDLKVGKMTNYFPRIVADYDGLFAAYNKKFGADGRTILDKLLGDAAKKQYKTIEELTMEERGDIITKALRGYGGKINVGSVTKSRAFKELPPEFLKFYHKPEDALTMYASKMNDKITLKKIFGLTGNEQASIGSLVDGMKLTPNELYSLKESLGAILSPQGAENKFLNTIRKSATLTLLAHVSSALFQIADVGVSMYKNGGMRALAALFQKSPFKRDEMFTDIMHEFADAQMIKKSLKWVGFDKLDQINSEAFMAAAFRKAGSEAKLGKGAKYDDLMERLKPMFQGDEAKAKKVMDDLANQVVNKDTQYYVFNQILDVSPRALMEMPEAYLKNPNARMFYSMKSYGLKILDVYRNDVVRNWKKNPKKSVRNFVILSAYLTASGATGTQLRDWYNGKETKFSDNVMNNFFQITMITSYDAGNIQRDGLGKVLLTKILPPSRVLDDISKDLVGMGDGKGLYSVRDIPIVGGDIYNRVGRGQAAIEKANKQNK